MQAQANVSRRELAAFGAAALAAATLKAEPAQAFLGFGEGAAREEAYKSDTVSIAAAVTYSPRDQYISTQVVLHQHPLPPDLSAVLLHGASSRCNDLCRR